MKNTNVYRRNFLLVNVTAIASAALLAKLPAALAADNQVQETDPTAQSLGYRADASHVDKAKYPAYVAGQNCANCALYQGPASSSSGPCPIFGGKVVSATGWCSAYSKKG
ncbi:high-potential iron-sulfur protein [Paraburkholderia silviterrae]|uniref:High-potential iron-sulfur protein n=1 Tax=Paraburkholderia silviterrae TaxID=2528715 RepID=A0A4R5LYQ0_9BURK|nr:high-potential iron-sulfur protein [Paraburkholderia silviterrae]TDG17479.1 High potential iron-sulfur protein [Paraburkholderia silviterrae]